MIFSLIETMQQGLRWWWQGLSRPFTRPVVLGADTNLTGLGHSNHRYLQVPANKTLNVDVSRLSGLEVDELIKQKLPFSANELYAVLDQQQLWAVPKNDVHDLIEKVEKHRHALAGISLGGQSDPRPYRLHPIFLPVRAMIGISVLLGLLVFGLNHFQDKLSSEVAALTRALDTQIDPATNIAQQFGQPNARDATQLATLLSTIAQNLAADDQVQQLSADLQGVTLDLSSRDILASQANLNASSEFSAVDTIGQISSTAQENIERSRLQLRMADAP